jgi:hypothetical protein
MHDTRTDINTAGITPVAKGLAPNSPSCSVRLSARDETDVLAAAKSPPEPNEAAVTAARRFLNGHG